MITRNFKLCLNAGTALAPYINVNQYDHGEQWVFTLYNEGGTIYTPSTGAIIGIKADGRAIANAGSVVDGKVVINETEQMTAAAGRAIYELLIDDDSHGTANFVVNVERRPADDADFSDSDLSLIQQAVDSAATIEDLLDGHDPDEVIADAVDAWLDAHPEATTTVEDGAITSAKLNDEVKTGVFEDMTVGTSLAVMNDEGVTDNFAYKFRQTGGNAVRELDEIHGGTIAWNQLVEELSSAKWASENGVTATYDNGVATISSTVANNGIYMRNLFSALAHKYLMTIDIKTESTLNVRLVVSSTQVSVIKDIVAGNWTRIAVAVSNENVVNTRLNLYGFGQTYSNLMVKNIQIFDLTQMFGSAVADAIYAMEQSSAGSGVAYFRSLFPNSYYAYNSGELVSVEGLSAHETTGFNQWDEVRAYGYYAEGGAWWTTSQTVSSLHPIPIIEGERYYCRVSGSAPVYFVFMDTYVEAGSSAVGHTIGARNNYANSSFTPPSGAKYMHFNCGGAYGQIYNHDICINISSSLNGTYKPYTKHTYPLDSSLTLRGVPKWNNGLYYDGDIYRHDGSVSRRYGVVDLGSLTWAPQPTYHSCYASLTGLIRVSTSENDRGLMCGKYPSANYWWTESNKPDGTISHGAGDNIVIKDSSFDSSTGAQIATALSGVYLVYELATPTAETADPYQQYQICDGKGTEEYVSETVTPVGHNTFYPVDIVAKVNKLPSDFSTLIAPTEEGFKATRNYTAKQFLIVNNQLYKVTANIANGATITPNTNVTAVTIADILTTLI